MVAAGTYAEALTVNKQVTILGANAGLAHDDALRGAETVIKGRVDITAADATLNGVTLTKPDTSVDTGTGTNFTGWTGINVMVTGTGATIANSIIEGFGAHGGFASSGFVTFMAGGGASFTGNAVVAGAGYNALSDARGVASVFVSNSATGQVTISDNALSLSTDNADAVNITGGAVTVQDNTIAGGAGGIVAFDAHGDLVITGNDISGFTDNGIRVLNFSGAADNEVTISGNTVDGPNAFQLDANPSLLYVIDGAAAAVLDSLAQLADFVAENGGEGRVLVQFLQSWAPQTFDFDGKTVSTVKFGDGADNDLSGGAGNDLLVGGEGNDTLDGQGGDDTVVVSGNVADYTWTGTSSDFALTDTAGGDDTDSLSNIEFVQFADITLSTAELFATVKLYDADGSLLGGFTTIQAAIDAATGGIGETIEVAAGTFDGDVTVNKAVTLQGAQSGVAVDDAGRGTGESVIGGRVLVTADGASIDGFTLSKPSTSTSGNGLNFAGWGGNNLTVDADGVSIGNTIVEAFGAAGGFAHSGFVRLAGDGTDFSGNLVRAGSGYNALGDARGVSGVWVNGAAGDAITVADNQVLVSTNNADGIFVMAGIATVTGNTISGTNGGFVAWNTYGDLVFTGNDISNVTGSSIRILPSSLDPQVTVTGNTIDNDDPITFELSGDSTVEGGDGDDVVNGTGAAAIDFTGGDGDDTYRPGAGGGSFDGGDGADTLDLALLGGGATVNLSTGQATGSAIGTILLTGVENVTGTTDDDGITGDGAANLLAGGDGNDTLVGMGGTDTLDGGAGTDTADFSASNAAVLANLVLGAAFGADIGNVTLTSVENLIGGADNDVLMGANTGHMLDGGAGLDTLIGGMGADTLIGGAGADLLTGGEGNDSMDGGFGADTMTGGLGDDTYVVDNVGDVVIEAAGGGTDTVLTARNHRLAAHVENLVLQGSDNRSGTGNAENNVLTGSDGNNVLSGLAGTDTLIGGAGNDTLNGGAGADSMVGGLGDDTYVVADANDIVVEALDEGIDTVQSWRSYSLGDDLENLELLDTADRTGSGNALDNLVTGNSGNNTLWGLDGNDVLNGADGNDVLNGGLGADTLYGGAGNDDLYGGQGDDFLAGGIGADTLISGPGADVFVFAQADVGTGVDQVFGFAKGQDRIGLSADLVAWLESGGNDALDVLGWDQATSTLSVDMALVGPGGVSGVGIPSTVDLAVITHNGSLLLREDDFLFL